MNIYLLKSFRSDGTNETRWSHSKLDLIHDGQEALKKKASRAQVYKVSIVEKTPRMLVIRLLNKQPLERTYELVWEQKAKTVEKDYPEIEPATL